MWHRKPASSATNLGLLLILSGPPLIAAPLADMHGAPGEEERTESCAAQWFPRAFHHSGEVIVIQVFVGRGTDGRYIIPYRVQNRTGPGSTCGGYVLAQSGFPDSPDDAPFESASSRRDLTSIGPTRSSFALHYSLERISRSRIGVYHSRGYCMAHLQDTTLGAGEHCITWDGRNDSGEWVASDLYYIRLEIDHIPGNRS